MAKDRKNKNHGTEDCLNDILHLLINVCIYLLMSYLDVLVSCKVHLLINVCIHSFNFFTFLLFC